MRCAHREHLDDDEYHSTGEQCTKEAGYTCCNTFGPVCKEHKCRCSQQILYPQDRILLYMDQRALAYPQGDGTWTAQSVDHDYCAHGLPLDLRENFGKMHAIMWQKATKNGGVFPSLLNPKVRKELRTRYQIALEMWPEFNENVDR